MIGIPYRLAFAGRDHRNPTLPAYEPKGSPGSYGDAGWTVMHVATDKLIAALTALPRAAWLPGTYRVAEQNGVAW